MSFRKLLAAACVIAALIPSSAFGEAGSSTIAGVVKDATGEALRGDFPDLRTGAGASVVIYDPTTRQPSTAPEFTTP